MVVDNIMTTYDPNMNTAYSWAKKLGGPPPLPKSLEDCIKLAYYIEFLNNVIGGQELWNFDEERRSSFIKNIGEQSRDSMLDVTNPEDRANISLRLWAGGTDAAKMIRDTYVVSTRNYPSGKVITCEEKIRPKDRQETFKNMIDVFSQEDHLYKAGVEAAPIIRKKIRNQQIIAEGIPTESAIMKYLKCFEQ